MPAPRQQFLVCAVLDDFTVTQHENPVACRTVESRWATTKQVRRAKSFRARAGSFARSARPPRWWPRRGSGMRGCATIARVKVSNCRSPALKLPPRSPTLVWYPSLEAARMISWVPSVFAAVITSSSRRAGPAELEVLHHRAGEEEVLLRDDADLFMERFDGGGLQIDAVHRDAPALRFVETRDEADDAGLARAGVRRRARRSRRASPRRRCPSAPRCPAAWCRSGTRRSRRRCGREWAAAAAASGRFRTCGSVSSNWKMRSALAAVESTAL